MLCAILEDSLNVIGMEHGLHRGVKVEFLGEASQTKRHATVTDTCNKCAAAACIGK